MTLNNLKISSKTQNQLNFKILIEIKSIILGDGKEKEHLGEHLSHQMELIDTKFDLSRGKNTCQPKLLPPSIKIL
jgi:hypothetical protein